MFIWEGVVRLSEANPMNPDELKKAGERRT
jgi:hypothetical protein